MEGKGNGLEVGGGKETVKAKKERGRDNLKLIEIGHNYI